jgi:S1-C subfamily serine protease
MFRVEMRLRGTHGNSTANFVTASATVVWEDTRRDISILKINEQAFKERTKFTVAQLDDAIRAEGEAVFIAGFPWGSKNTITSAGVLASLEPPSLDRPGREDVYLAAITSEVGNSGAPAFLASTGEVVGMVVGGISDRVWVDGKSGTYAWGEEVGPDNTTAKVQLDYASGLTEILPAFQITDLLRKRHIVYRSR